MSLQSRLAAFATAVGADIKALRADVAAVGTVSPKSFQFGLQAAQSVGGGLPINWTSEVVDTANLRNTNLTQVTLPAGTWWVEAVVRPDSSLSAGGYIQAFLQVNGVNRQEGVATQITGSTPPSCVIAGTPVVSDGTTTVRVIVYTNSTGSVFNASTTTTLTATISGGVKGDQGDAGSDGQVEVYEQPDEPLTSEIGAIWIKGG